MVSEREKIKQLEQEIIRRNYSGLVFEFAEDLESGNWKWSVIVLGVEQDEKEGHVQFSKREIAQEYTLSEAINNAFIAL